MSEWTDKTRGMLEYFPNLPLRSDTRSWKCFDNEGTLLFEFKPWDKSGCRFEDLAMFSLFSSSPTLLREACEMIKRRDKVIEALRNHQDRYGSAWDDVNEALSALDAKEQS